MDRFGKAVMEMEMAYKRVTTSSQAPVREALMAALCIVKVHLNSLEFYLPIIGMFLFIHSSGSVLSFGDESGAFRAFYAITVSLVGVLVPILLSLLLLPLHILFDVRYRTVVIANVVLSAYALSFVYMFSLPHEITKEFSQLIFPLLLVYGIPSLIVTVRMAGIVCFITFRKAQIKGGVKSLIPLQKRGALLRMMAQDHYVEITTTLGSHLNRISMKEAVESVSEREGMHLHRSHWVAYSAMRSIENSRGRIFLVVQNGDRIPVSKSKLPQVQAYLDSR